MKSNTTHHPPTTPIEDLGDGTFYFNFKVTESTIEDNDGGTHKSYDYEQVRVFHPVTVERIEEALLQDGYELESIEL